MLEWKIVYHEQFLPQMKVLKEAEEHADKILVKCYCKDPDGKARWQLHLLKRNGAIYKDIPLDTLKLIERITQAYHMNFNEEKGTICLTCNGSEDASIAEQSIEIDRGRIEAVPLGMIYGNVVMADLSQMKIKLSMGITYEEMGIRQVGDYYVTGDITIGEDRLEVTGIRIEND
ncbi:MAG: hypothetical protein E7294_00265 [Lachnospiraceae bacterium]|nr:hypothetical protein [Lachnospiraceae bacterium]